MSLSYRKFTSQQLIKTLYKKEYCNQICLPLAFAGFLMIMIMLNFLTLTLYLLNKFYHRD